MLTNSLRTDIASRFDRSVAQRQQACILLSLDKSSRLGASENGHIDQHALCQSQPMARNLIDARVEVAPSELVRRHAAAWRGMVAEIVQSVLRGRTEYRFRAPFHLLVLYEQGARSAGETIIDGLPRSTLRDFKHKLTFVPAGHEYHEWHDSRFLSRVVYFYFDPACMPLPSELGAARAFAPRLFFEDAALRETALKLATLIERGADDNGAYVEALGAVLAHELVRVNQGTSRKGPPVRGGLAPWQQRIAIGYIEEHLAEQVTLAKLAELVRLSPFYFCRAFKQSFGLPPHRYHTNRRIEHAKALLGSSSPSVTDIGLTVGFSDTSSFTAAFRRATGLTPTTYRRNIA
ncbi:MAG: helix-turn-helix domain-containing protein [Candidatus Sulfotelmatobacter sp.]